ncbi:hypothetical protein Tco_0897469, partial [Tanacetum coccineum]
MKFHHRHHLSNHHHHKHQPNKLLIQYQPSSCLFSKRENMIYGLTDTMEHIWPSDYPIWEVIKWNGPVSITTDTSGQIKFASRSRRDCKQRRERKQGPRAYGLPYLRSFLLSSISWMIAKEILMNMSLEEIDLISGKVAIDSMTNEKFYNKTGVIGQTHQKMKDYALMACNSSDSDTENGKQGYLADFQDLMWPIAFGGSKVISLVKLPDENQVYLNPHTKNNDVQLSILENIVLQEDWENLSEVYLSKIFKMNITCVACQKGKQHKASCKAKAVSSISHTLQLLYMDLFGPTSVRRLNHKTYCLVITDDFSRFRIAMLLKFCGLKGSSGYTSNARNSQQTGVVRERQDSYWRLLGPLLAIFLPKLFGLKQLSTMMLTNMQLKTAEKRDVPREEEQVFMDELERLKRQEKEANEEAEALRSSLNKKLRTWLYKKELLSLVEMDITQKDEKTKPKMTKPSTKWKRQSQIKAK